MPGSQALLRQKCILAAELATEHNRLKGENTGLQCKLKELEAQLAAPSNGHSAGAQPGNHTPPTAAAKATGRQVMPACLHLRASSSLQIDLSGLAGSLRQTCSPSSSRLSAHGRLLPRPALGRAACRHSCSGLCKTWSPCAQASPPCATGSRTLSHRTWCADPVAPDLSRCMLCSRLPVPTCCVSDGGMLMCRPAAVRWQVSRTP